MDQISIHRQTNFSSFEALNCTKLILSFGNATQFSITAFPKIKKTEIGEKQVYQISSIVFFLKKSVATKFFSGQH